MKKFIVSTTINQPTKAIKLFDAMEDWHLVVVGDKKTPPDYKLERGTYLSPDEQDSFSPKLSAAIPWNCIQRRSLGFLWAYRQGADIIATVDDDNIPYEWWGRNILFEERSDCYHWGTDQPCFDPVFPTENSNLWHRGFPLQLVAHRKISDCGFRKVTPHIQADLWNGAPDIDAVCRMVNDPLCEFSEQVCAYPFHSNKPSPFNSQNTFLSHKVIPHYFMFPGIGRMDDIWASYHVQALGFKVVYGKPSVYQERNPHDVTKDFEDEILGYRFNLKLIEDLEKSPTRIFDYLPPESAQAFRIYQDEIAR